jgi:predicted metal-dependent peptidase
MNTELQNRLGIASNLDKRIRKQIGKLIFLEPFFASLALGMKIVIDDEPDTTAYVSGDRMGFGPDFWDKLNPKQQRTLICHEVMHKALLHDLRIPNEARIDSSVFRIWNQACDFAINQHLTDRDRFEFPPDGQTNPMDLARFKNQSAEQIFKTLMDERKDEEEDENEDEKQPDEDTEGDGEGDGEGDSEGDTEGDKPTETEQPPKPREWGEVRPSEQEADKPEQEARRKREVRQAIHSAQQAGNMPAGITTDIEKTFKPTVQWEMLLERFIESISPVDYSYRSPKQIGDIILPSFSAESLGRLAVVVDTSGSMTPPHLEKAISELRGATQVFAEQGMPDTFSLIYADTEVHSAVELLPDDPIPSPKGGGGTDFTSAFDFIDKLDEPPIGVIVLTDGFVHVDKLPEAESLFLITPNGSPQFGNDTDLAVVRMEN